jgi:hypothetical protein
MLGSTRVRVVIGLAVLGTAVAAYQWWVSPERQIRRTIRDVVGAVAHDEPDTDLRAIAAVAALQTLLTPDVIVDLGPTSSSPLTGRQDVVSLAARLRTSTPILRVQLFDETIAFSNVDAATVRFTAQITVRDGSGEELADAHQVIATLVRADGQWLVSRATLVRKSERL